MRSELTRPSQNSVSMREEIEERRRVPRDELSGRDATRAGPSPVAPWPIERLRPSPVREAGQVAGHAGDVVVAAEDLVERERLAEPDQLGPDRSGALERSDPAAGGEDADFGGEGGGTGLGRGRAGDGLRERSGW